MKLARARLKARALGPVGSVGAVRGLVLLGVIAK